MSDELTTQLKATFDGSQASKGMAEMATAAERTGRRINEASGSSATGLQRIKDAAASAASGMDAGEKRIASSMQKMAINMASGTDAAKKFELQMAFRGMDASKFQPYLQGLREIQVEQDKATQSAKSLTETTRSMASGLGALAAGFVGGAFMRKFIAETVAAEQEQAQLAAVIKSTGASAGWTQQQLNDMAASMAEASNFSGGEINKAQTRLLAYTGIVGKAVPQTMRAILDMSARTGQSVEQSAEMLGKAINLPSQGMTSLRKMGFEFGEEQIELAKKLEASGKLYEAQKIVLDELESSYGGAAKAARDTLGGAMKAVQKDLDSLMTGEGATVPSLRNAFEDLHKTLSSQESKEGFQAILGNIAAVIAMSIRGIAALGQLANAASMGMKESAHKTASKNFDWNNKKYEEAAALAAAEPANPRWQKEMQKYRAAMQVDLSKMEGIAASMRPPDPVVIPEVTVTPPKISSGGGDGKRDPSVGKQESAIAAIKARIAAEQELAERLALYGAKAEELSEGDKLVIKLKKEIAETTNGATRAAKEGQLVYALQLQAVQNANRESQKQIKMQAEAEAGYRKYIDGIFKSAGALGDMTDKQDAANASFGKSKVAIAEMAMEEAKLAAQNAKDMGPWDAEQVAALQKLADEHQRYVASLKEGAYIEASRKYDDQLRAARDELQIQQYGMSLLGVEENQRQKLLAVRRSELAVQKEITQIEKQSYSNDPTVDEQRKAELIRQIRLNAETNLQTELSRIQEQAINEHVQQYDDIFRRGFADMLNNGKDGWDSFTKSLTTTFKTTVADQIYKMFLRPFVVKVVAQMVGMTGASQELPGTGVAGGSGLTGGGLTDWSTWGNSASSWASDASFKMVSNGWSEMGSSMMGLSRTITSVDSYLKTIPGMSGGIGSAAGYLGSIYALTQGQYGTGLGSAIGTAILPGIGTMIGGALGGLVDSLFGGDDIPRYAATAQYSGGVTSKGWTPGDQWNDALYPAVEALASGIGKALDTTAETFGKTAGYSLFASFSKDAEEKGVFGALSITGPDGQSLIDWSQYDAKWGGRHFSDGEAGQKEFMAAITADVKTAFQAMDIPTWSKQLINAAENIDGINAALQQVGATKSLFESWAKSMGMFKDISGELQTQLLNSFGGNVDALASGVGAFYEGLYSEQERMAILAGNLRDSLAGMSIGIDPALGETAKAQFKSAVEAAMAGGQGELSAKLLAMSQSFVTAADYAQKATDSLRSSLIGLEGKFAGGGFSRQYQAEDLASQVQGLLSGVGISKDAGVLAQTLLSATSADVESYFREIWNVLPTDEARQQLVDVAGAMLDLAAAADAAAQAVAAEREGLEQRWLQAIGDTAEMRRRELEALDPSNRALLEMIYGLEDAKQSMADLTTASQQAAQKAAAAWQGWGTAAGLSAQYLGDTSGLEARRAILGAQISASTDPADRLSKLQELISIEQAIGQAQQASRKTELDAINTRQSALQKEISAAQQLLSAAQSLGDYAHSLQFGATSGLSDADRLAALSGEYNLLIGKARGGDADALKQLQGVSSDYLGLAQTLAVSGADYSVLSGRIASELDKLATGQESTANWQISSAQSQLDQLTAQSEALNAQVEISDATKGLIAKSMIDQAEIWDRENSQYLSMIELQGSMTDRLGTLPADIYRSLRPAFDSNASYIAGSVGSTVSGAISALAKMLGLDGSHANGLSYVPFDGYRAELHKGERVLTAAENSRYSAPVPLPFVVQASQGNAELIAEVRALREQNTRLEARLAVIESNTGALYDLTDQKSEGGNADRVELMNVESLASAIAEKMKETA